jgi:hypothetical protein
VHYFEILAYDLPNVDSVKIKKDFIPLKTAYTNKIITGRKHKRRDFSTQN